MVACPSFSRARRHKNGNIQMGSAHSISREFDGSRRTLLQPLVDFESFQLEPVIVIECRDEVTVDICGRLIPGANVSFVDKLDGVTCPQESARQPQERKRRESGGFMEVLPNQWLGGRDSNPDTQIQSLEPNFYPVGLLGTFPHPASPFCMAFGA